MLRYVGINFLAAPNQNMTIVQKNPKGPVTSLLVARHGFAIGPILNLICAVILVLSISSDHQFFFFTLVPAVLPCLAITLNIACLGLGQVYKESNSSLVSVRIGVVLTGIISVIASSPLFYFMELNLRFDINHRVKKAIFSLHPSFLACTQKRYTMCSALRLRDVPLSAQRWEVS